jgi:general secretion pathway protein K
VRPVPREEQGVALLTVLLLVAVLATLAAVVLDDIRFGLRRTANAEAVGQGRWYALGAESLAAARIQDVLRRADGEARLVWREQAVELPLDQGLIRTRIRDASTCFNLNSVAQGRGEVFSPRPEGLAQFKALAVAVGLAPAEAEQLGAALVDWIDSDGVREAGGAEDEAYLTASPPYRTAGGPLAEVSELRAIRGFTPEVYARLRPVVCALPTTDLSPVNVNALDPDDGVLVTMLTEGKAAPEVGRRLIAARPADGWSESAFWMEPLVFERQPADPGQIETRPRFFALETVVTHLDAEVVATGLIEVDQSGQTRLVARRWTLDE